MATIAIIEDEPRIAGKWAAALTETGHRVTQYVTGQAAVEALSDAPPNVLVIDIRLDHPLLGGYDVLRQLRRSWGERSAGTKVLMVSARQTEVVDEWWR